jgi:hypothetical protein
MWWWKNVRRADIPAELRDRSEAFGEDVLAHALAAGDINPNSQGIELIGLLQQKCREEITESPRTLP